MPTAFDLTHAHPRSEVVAGPPRGRGHYSPGGDRWWDERTHDWHDLAATSDTAELVIEDVGGHSWLTSILTTLGNQCGGGYYRFVAQARSTDARWPRYDIPGPVFTAPRAFVEQAPQPAWAEAMDDSEHRLRTQLAEEGWVPTGPRSYARRCLADV